MIDQRASDIFRDLESKGIAAVNAFLTDRASEELFLDFKMVSPEYKVNSLGKSDEDNLAKAISGFANSCGGVIVWGVNCSGRGQKPDLADGLALIPDAKAFRATIEGTISRATIPPHTGVCNCLILEPGTEQGYVATLVPLSDEAPLRAVGKGLHRYYVRAGSDFVVMDHRVLSGMFGRKPQAVLDLAIIDVKISNSQRIAINLSIRNTGGTIARDFFAVLDVPVGTIEGLGLTELDGWENFNLGSQATVMAPPGGRLPPGSTKALGTITIPIQRDAPNNITIKARLGCEGSATNHWETTLETINLPWISDVLVDAQRDGRHDFTPAEKREILSYFRGA